MIKSRVRITSCVLWVLLTILGFQSASPVKADTFTVTGAQDWYFKWYEPQIVTFTTNAQVFGIDSMLWLYNDETNQLISQNDDYMSLDSYIRFEPTVGTQYRLRTGVCCGNPDAWYGNSYELLVNGGSPIQTTTTTQVVTPESTTTTLPPTTTTEVPVTTTSTTTSTTTTTTVAPTTTIASTTTTIYLVPVPETLAPSTTLAPTTTTSTTTTSTSTTTSSTSTSTTTTVAPVVQQVPSTTTTVVVPETTTTSTVQTTVPSTTTIPLTEVISNGIDSTEALTIVTSVEVLRKLTSTEASQVFEAVEVGELTDDQAEALVEAVQSAPEEVRASFESEINIFEGKFDNYVPIGSNVTVGQRKVLVAATGVLFMAPVVSVSSSTSTSSDSRNNSGRRK